MRPSAAPRRPATRAVPRGRPALVTALALALVVCAAAAAGCSSEDVTGEPEDIGTLVQVVPEGSRCVHDSGTGEVRFEVRLRNTGDDERTVTVTPVRRFADGDDVGSSLEAFEVTVPGRAEEDGDIVLDDVPEDLEACFVRLDDGDELEVELQEGDA